MVDDKTEGPAVIQFGEFRLDRCRHRLQRNSVAVKLATKPCEVLGFLAINHYRPVSKEELLKAVWGNEDGDPNLVQQNIRQIRLAVETDPKNPRWIVTVGSAGYRFMGPVSFLPLDAIQKQSHLNGIVDDGTQHATPLLSAENVGIVHEPESPLTTDDKTSKSAAITTRHSLSIVVAAGLVLVSGIGVVLYATAPGEPAACEVSVNTLVVKDGQGREVWRHEFPEHLNTQRYRDRPPLCRFADLDRDGVADVLFVLNPAAFNLESDTLYGFITPSRLMRRFHASPKRTLTFHPGASLVVGPNSDPASKKPYDEYLPPYAIAGVYPEPVGGSENRIVVSSVLNEAPNEITVLKGDLTKVSEYWHAGHLRYGQFATYNGKERIFLAGVNNGYHAATLVAFDPNNVNGTTDLSLDLPNRDLGFTVLAKGTRGHLSPLGAGTETCRVLFERTCVAKAKPHREPYNRVINLTVNADRIIVTIAEGEREDMPETVTYFMDRHLNVVDLGANTNFRQRHLELEQERLLDHPFSLQELKPLIHVLPGCEFVEKAQ